jgi:hypothetical protein
MCVCRRCLGLASGERCSQDRKLLVGFEPPEALGGFFPRRACPAQGIEGARQYFPGSAGSRP